jgi:hypothetical protein
VQRDVLRQVALKDVLNLGWIFRQRHRPAVASRSASSVRPIDMKHGPFHQGPICCSSLTSAKAESHAAEKSQPTSIFSECSRAARSEPGSRPNDEGGDGRSLAVRSANAADEQAEGESMPDCSETMMRPFATRPSP